ncbi:MAG: hypothetical protein HC792_03135 [Acaryochloridaceae cyanobacterium CSU_5_19]|nr:hypothetical protein [Acaryochloridaceae cyanobacterium CSU_5_19]
MRELQRGGLALFYIDGNTGTAGLKGGEKHGATFQLLAMPVRMRTGIAFLAHKAQVPIVVAVTYYNPAGEAMVEFLEQIPPPADSSDAARVDCTTTIYSHFEAYLQRYPAQWEGWFYPHRFLENIEHSPMAMAIDLQQVQDHIVQCLENNENRLLQANSLQVCVLPSPQGTVIFDGKARRMLQVNPLAGQTVQAALQGVGLAQLRQQLGTSPAALAHELSRLILSGLITIADSSLPGLDPSVLSVPTRP